MRARFGIGVTIITAGLANCAALAESPVVIHYSAQDCSVSGQNEICNGAAQIIDVTNKVLLECGWGWQYYVPNATTTWTDQLCYKFQLNGLPMPSNQAGIAAAYPELSYAKGHKTSVWPWSMTLKTSRRMPAR